MSTVLGFGVKGGSKDAKTIDVRFPLCCVAESLGSGRSLVESSIKMAVRQQAQCRCPPSHGFCVQLHCEVGLILEPVLRMRKKRWNRATCDLSSWCFAEQDSAMYTATGPLFDHERRLVLLWLSRVPQREAQGVLCLRHNSRWRVGPISTSERF